MMENTVQKSKKRTILPKFSNTTLGIIIRGRMRETERGKEFKGGKRDNWGIGERGERDRWYGQMTRKPKKGWASRLSQPAAPSPWY